MIDFSFVQRMELTTLILPLHLLSYKHRNSLLCSSCSKQTLCSETNEFPLFFNGFFCSKNICFYYYRDLSQHIRRNFINSLLKSVKTRSLKMYMYLCNSKYLGCASDLGQLHSSPQILKSYKTYSKVKTPK